MAMRARVKTQTLKMRERREMQRLLNLQAISNLLTTQSGQRFKNHSTSNS